MAKENGVLKFRNKLIYLIHENDESDIKVYRNGQLLIDADSDIYRQVEQNTSDITALNGRVTEAEEKIENIPDDYTDLVNDVTDLKSAFDETIIKTDDGNLYANPMLGVRTVQSATKLQFYGSLDNPNTNYLTARIPVEPNTEYSVIFESATDYIQIVSASNEIVLSNFSQSNPQTLVDSTLITSKTDRSITVFHFTTNADANYVYICSTITGETDVNIYMAEGNVSTIPQSVTWVKNLDTYNKDQLESTFETKKYIHVEPTTTAVNVYIPVKSNLYSRFTISHVIDHSDAEYVDYWRIAQSALFTYDGESFTATGKIPLIGAENEMAINFQGMGDHTGGWHGDERIDLENGCYCVFIVDGQEYTISELVSLGNITCDSFGYREVSQLYASYSYNVNHLPIAKHTKITSFGNSGFKTKNYVGVDLTSIGIDTIKILNAYTGLFCIGKDFASVAVSDIGTEYTASHPTSTTILAEEMNKYDLSAKTYNDNYSCEIDSKLINSSIESYKNAPVNVDIWDRRQDLKYYSFLPEATVETGDYFATESTIKWNTNN